MLNMTDAFLLGVRANHDGKKCIPAFDNNLMDFVKEQNGKVGASIPYFKAWQKGWISADLAKNRVVKQLR